MTDADYRRDIRRLYRSDPVRMRRMLRGLETCPVTTREMVDIEAGRRPAGDMIELGGEQPDFTAEELAEAEAWWDEWGRSGRIGRHPEDT